MDFRDKDGGPLVDWHDAPTAFGAWKRCSAGQPCDYTGLSYEKLRVGGVQWPCAAESAEGAERLYTDGITWAHPDVCESSGRVRELRQGPAHRGPGGTRRLPFDEPARQGGHQGRRVRPAPGEDIEGVPPPAQYRPHALPLPHPHQDRPRTAAERRGPDVWAELSPGEAAARGLAEGDLVEVPTARGAVHARLRISAIRDGAVFLPFHYGYWDTPGGHQPGAGGGRAANETTVTDWDPASKQPLFKAGAAQVRALAHGDGTPAPAPTTTASEPASDHVAPTVGGPGARAGHRTEDPAGGA